MLKYNIGSLFLFYNNLLCNFLQNKNIRAGCALARYEMGDRAGILIVLGGEGVIMGMWIFMTFISILIPVTMILLGNYIRIKIPKKINHYFVIVQTCL